MCSVRSKVGPVPDVVSAAVGSIVSDDTGVPLSQRCMALTAQQAGHMPVEIWSNVEPEIIIDVLLASVAHLPSPIYRSFCRGHQVDIIHRKAGGWREGVVVTWLLQALSAASSLTRTTLSPTPRNARDLH